MTQYFINDNLFTKTKEQVIQYMIENCLTELTVRKSVKIKVNGFFYCKINGVAEKDYMTCGVKWCSDYKPRNRKSGCCKHIGNLYEAGKEVTFKL